MSLHRIIFSRQGHDYKGYDCRGWSSQTSLKSPSASVFKVKKEGEPLSYLPSVLF